MYCIKIIFKVLIVFNGIFLNQQSFFVDFLPFRNTKNLLLNNKIIFFFMNFNVKSYTLHNF